MMGTDASQYDRAKGSAGDADPAVRTALAANPETPPEILYFLAKDEAVAVRRAVAANPATPHQADIILAKDRDYGVRCELARKAVGEGLAVDKRRELWRMGFTILETLATDKVVRVRRALAEAIKSLVGAPRPVILRLARDTDREVAAPILRHSPVLTGKDLVKIVGPGAPEWAQKAVADRADISPDVADVVVASGSIPSITRLLKNTRARIRDETIERVVERPRMWRNGTSPWFVDRV